MKDACKSCFWNFDGVCASHSVDDPDTYGTPIEDALIRFPDGCQEFRHIPAFLTEQTEQELP